MNLVNSEFSILQKLIFSYTRGSYRPRYALLFALDNRLADVIRASNEPLIAQMKLAWWRDVLAKPAAQRPKGEPLVELLTEVEQSSAPLHVLEQLIDGWEVMLEDFPWDDRQFAQYAQNRGEGFFSFGLSKGKELGDTEAKFAQAWALWDFARNCSDKKTRQIAFEKYIETWPNGEKISFDSNGRPLSILCKLAESDVKKRKLSEDLYRPSVAGKIIWHGLTGL